MAAEEILLKVDLDEQKSFSDLEKLKLSLIRLQDERKKLNDAIKKGVITEEEYAKELVRVEQLMKSNQTAYNNLSKTVSGHKSKTDELIKSNKELQTTIQDAAKEINVMGVNLGGLLSTIATPQTGAIALVGALGAAYLKSAAGAEDFARAQNNINALLDQMANEVGNSTDGGFFQRASRVFSIAAINLTSNTKEEAARRKENLGIARQDLEYMRELQEAQITSAEIRKRTEKEAEDARRIRDDSQKTYNERIEAANTVELKLLENDQVRTANLKEQVKTLLDYGEAVGSIKEGTLEQYKTEGKITFENITSRDTRIEIRKLLAEIADIHEEINGKLTENIKAEQAITAEVQKQREAKSQEQIEQDINRARAAYERQNKVLMDAYRTEREIQQQSNDLKVQNEEKAADAMLSAQKKLSDDTTRIKQKADSAQVSSERSKIESYAMLTNQTLRLMTSFGAASKAAALTQLGIDTALAISHLVEASQKNPLNGPTSGAAGIAQFAAGILQISANIRQAYAIIGESAPAIGAGGGGNDTQREVKSILGYTDEELAQLGLTVNKKGRIVSNKKKWWQKGLLDDIGFSDGGYTGPGSVMQPAGIVHAGEVVWSQKDVAAVGGPKVANSMRPTYKGYNDGGLVTNTMPANNRMTPSNFDIQVYTSWVEMKKFADKMQIKNTFIEA